MNKSLLATLSLILASSTPAFAQEAAAKKTISVDGAAAMPAGDWGDGAGFGIGALARLEIPFRPRLSFSVRLGYIHHLSKTIEDDFGEIETSSNEIPALGGIQYGFGPDVSLGLFGFAETGMVRIGFKQTADGEKASDSDTNLGANFGVGYRTGKLDIRGGLFLPDLGEAGDAYAVMVTAGFEVASL